MSGLAINESQNVKQLNKVICVHLCRQKLNVGAVCLVCSIKFSAISLTKYLLPFML